MLKSYLTRIVVCLICCVISHQIPNLGQLLNFQGALTGTMITFLFPIVAYLKIFKFSELNKIEKAKCLFTLVYGTIGGVIATIVAVNSLIS